MPETLALADGEEMPLDEAKREYSERDFYKAMAAPEPEEPEAPAPRRKADPRGARQPEQDKPGHSRPRVSDTPGQAPRRPGRPSKAAEAPKPKDYTEGLTEACQQAYGYLALTGNLADAGAVKIHGPGLVHALNTAAQNNQYARRGVEWLVKGAGTGAVLLAVMPFALQIMANHGQVPIERVAALGVKDPNALAAETEKDLAEMAAMAEAA